jgi:hypothetical protein
VGSGELGPTHAEAAVEPEPEEPPPEQPNTVARRRHTTPVGNDDVLVSGILRLPMLIDSSLMAFVMGVNKDWSFRRSSTNLHGTCEADTYAH